MPAPRTCTGAAAAAVHRLPRAAGGRRLEGVRGWLSVFGRAAAWCSSGVCECVSARAATTFCTCMPAHAALTHLFSLRAPFSLRRDSWQSGDPADPGFKFCCLCSSAGVVSAGRLSCCTTSLCHKSSCVCCALQTVPKACASLQGNTADLLMCSSCQLSGFCFGCVPASRVAPCCLERCYWRCLLLRMWLARRWRLSRSSTGCFSCVA